VAGPWFTVHRLGEGWKSLDKIWISNGAKSDIAVVQTRVRFADEKGKNIYQDDALNVAGFDFAKELDNVARNR
jgi:hypothetical protein